MKWTEKFGIKLLVVKTIAKIIGSDQPQTKTVKSRRFSEGEREVLVGRIEAGETVEDIGAKLELLKIHCAVGVNCVE
jgi:hypothetical protein